MLVHQDAELADPELCGKVRELMADPEVAIAGCVGSTGARGIAWWEGDVSGGSAVCAYGELGGGETPAVAFGGDGTPRTPRMGAVDTLDGFVLVMSPWAARTLRFDESLGFLDGHDFDICQQARAAGRSVVTADLAVRTTAPFSSPATTSRGSRPTSHREKWHGRVPGAEPKEGEEDWPARARRAEAEAALARLLVLSREMQRDAQQESFEQRLRQMTETSSWRITEPLRHLNKLRKKLRGRPAL